MYTDKTSPPKKQRQFANRQQPKKKTLLFCWCAVSLLMIYLYINQWTYRFHKLFWANLRSSQFKKSCFHPKYSFYIKFQLKMQKKICFFNSLVYISNMHQAVQCWFGKPTWRNWQTRTVQVRVPRGMWVRLSPSVPLKIGCHKHS